MERIQDKSCLPLDVCLLAGKIMLQNGAETYRVEDTMVRMAAAAGFEQSHSFVTPTGIIFSMEGIEPTKLIRIKDRFTNLEKVTMVNQLSRQMATGEFLLEDIYQQLREIERSGDTYSISAQIAAAAIASGCFVIMFKGQWIDFLPALFTGGLGFSAVIFFHRIVEIRFFAEFFAALLIGAAALGLVYLGLGHQLDKIIIGAVMPLVPGLLITNAVRDLLAGHLIAGLSKGAEAFLTAFAIGTGVAVVFSFL
ncbi:hypothetical protein BEP19_04320 [Ammoniphilus oxalaticus]|uniref:Threonine/serine exporter-like N-terminal domain-containing protein n=1 Tax=Ammoniphilus oxalaticus TaxID=66863 RepID=A0A419SM55_9BACL|nr:threonine/serine exporter family protein [Ammoniphilus oxalaticus]RKD25054.1 hypothetical protein BEP19_04320 [Ammoniphilus oxalaticus]